MAADEEETKGGATEGAGTTAGTGAPGAERRARPRPAVTIDLTAEAMPPADPPKAEGARPPLPPIPPTPPTPPPPPPPGERPSAASFGGDALRGAATAITRDEGWRNAGLAGVAGGIVALIIVLLLQAVGVLPAPGRSAANQAIAQAKSASDATAALDRRVAALEAMIEGVAAIRTDLKSVGDRVAALEAGKATFATHGDVQAVAGSVTALQQKISDAPLAASQQDLAALADRVGKLEVSVAAGEGSNTDTTAIAALGTQLNDAETKVKALADRIDAADAKVAALGTPLGDGTAGRAIAAAALRRAAADGAPFAADVDLIAAYGVAANDIAALKPLATAGVKTTAAIAAEFPAVGDAILAATTANDPNSNFFRRLLDGLISVRPAGPVAGSDPGAIVSRMRDDAAKGDLAAALGERDALPDAGKQASAAWAAEAKNRVDLDTLAGRIADALDPPKPAPAG